MRRIMFVILLLFNTLITFSQEAKPLENKNPNSCSVKKIQLLFSENFSTDFSNWKVEFEKPESSMVKIVDKKLDVSASAGATVWFKHKLSGNVIVDKGDKNDRVSDMNAFWMATDPAKTNAFLERDGKFLSYDNLNLYYAGIGGHNNTFTRFRKYSSDGNKPVLQEYADAAHLLTGNKEYQIKIIVNNGLIQYLIDDE
ncbi:MAG: DUF6250 domain-containing protein, partial [Bacteroidia bacterium]|nr:DUF6250 domain-containing protein [Bacteroidia bacterium]